MYMPSDGGRPTRNLPPGSLGTAVVESINRLGFRAWLFGLFRAAAVQPPGGICKAYDVTYDQPVI